MGFLSPMILRITLSALLIFGAPFSIPRAAAAQNDVCANCTQPRESENLIDRFCAGDIHALCPPGSEGRFKHTATERLKKYLKSLKDKIEWVPTVSSGISSGKDQELSGKGRFVTEGLSAIRKNRLELELAKDLKKYDEELVIPLFERLRKKQSDAIDRLYGKDSPETSSLKTELNRIRPLTLTEIHRETNRILATIRALPEGSRLRKLFDPKYQKMLNELFPSSCDVSEDSGLSIDPKKISDDIDIGRKTLAPSRCLTKLLAPATQKKTEEERRQVRLEREFDDLLESIDYSEIMLLIDYQKQVGLRDLYRSGCGDYGLLPNAFYQPGPESRLVICPGFLVGLKGIDDAEKELGLIIGHEMGHSHPADPDQASRLTGHMPSHLPASQVPIDVEPSKPAGDRYSGIKACLKMRGLATSGPLDLGKTASEAIPDIWAAETFFQIFPQKKEEESLAGTLNRVFSRKKIDPEALDRLHSIQKGAQALCGHREKKKPFDDGPHPDAKTRLRLLMSTPSFRQALGCSESNPPLCSLGRSSTEKSATNP